MRVDDRERKLKILLKVTNRISSKVIKDIKDIYSMKQPLITNEMIENIASDRKISKIYLVYNSEYKDDKKLELCANTIVGIYLDVACAIDYAKTFVKCGNVRYITSIVEHDEGKLSFLEVEKKNFSDETKRVVDVLIDGNIVNNNLYSEYIGKDGMVSKKTCLIM